jgi:hypothetical protein
LPRGVDQVIECFPNKSNALALVHPPLCTHTRFPESFLPSFFSSFHHILSTSGSGS